MLPRRGEGQDGLNQSRHFFTRVRRKDRAPGRRESQNYKDVVLDNTTCCPEGVKARMARVQLVTCFKAIIGLPESLNYKDVVLDNTKCCPEGVKARMA